MYTHNLNRLRMYGESLDIVISIPDYIQSSLDKITGWEAGSRYDLHFSIRIDVLKRCLGEVEGWYTELYIRGYR